YAPGRKVHVIRNIPPMKDASRRQPRVDLRTQLRLPAGHCVVLYQGGLGPSRNLEPVIRALARVPRAVLVIRGPGIEHFAGAYLGLARECGCGGRVFCLPPVGSGEVVREARGADLGLYTVLGVGLNFRYALPNKVFEYLAAGLPVLCADYPEVRRLVTGY